MKKEHKEIQQGRAFRVRIRETLERVVTVYEGELKEATPDEAIQMVSDWWHTGQIVLECEDFCGVEFSDADAEEGGEADGLV